MAECKTSTFERVVRKGMHSYLEMHNEVASGTYISLIKKQKGDVGKHYKKDMADIQVPHLI